jgi:hypothetical protein
MLLGLVGSQVPPGSRRGWESASKKRSFGAEGSVVRDGEEEQDEGAR